MPTVIIFDVSGSGVGSGDLVGQFPATGVTSPFAPVQVPTYAVVTQAVPNSSASLDFSIESNSEYLVPLMF